MQTSKRQLRRRSISFFTLVSLLAVGPNLVFGQTKCKGTKELIRGKCRYPEGKPNKKKPVKRISCGDLEGNWQGPWVSFGDKRLHLLEGSISKSGKQCIGEFVVSIIDERKEATKQVKEWFEIKIKYKKVEMKGVRYELLKQLQKCPNCGKYHQGYYLDSFKGTLDPGKTKVVGSSSDTAGNTGIWGIRRKNRSQFIR